MKRSNAPDSAKLPSTLQVVRQSVLVFGVVDVRVDVVCTLVVVVGNGGGRESACVRERGGAMSCIA